MQFTEGSNLPAVSVSLPLRLTFSVTLSSKMRRKFDEQPYSDCRFSNFILMLSSCSLDVGSVKG